MTIAQIEKRDDVVVYMSEVCTHYPAQLRVEMNAEAVEEYAAAMQKGDQFPMPLLIDGPDGLIPVDGHHRIEAMRKIGQPSFKAQVAKVPDGVDAVDYARLLSIRFNNKHGVRKKRGDLHKERTAVVPLLLKAGLSNRQIGRELNCDEGTVRNIRSKLGNAGKVVRDGHLSALFGDFIETTAEDVEAIEQQTEQPTENGETKDVMPFPRQVSKEIQQRVKLNKAQIGVSEPDALKLFMSTAALLARMKPLDACAVVNALYTLQARAVA